MRREILVDDFITFYDASHMSIIQTKGQLHLIIYFDINSAFLKL